MILLPQISGTARAIQHGAVELYLTEAKSVPGLEHLVVARRACGVISIPGRLVDRKLPYDQTPLFGRHPSQYGCAACERLRGDANFGVGIARNTPNQTV